MVDQDAKDVNEMVLAAKYGKWRDVYSVLDRKPNLVNCIPEDRAWAVLHQAAWWEDQDAVEKLLTYQTCDSEVKTKQDRSNESGPGKTPSWIAQNLKSNARIAGILDQFLKDKRNQRFGGKIPTYITAKDGEQMDKNGLPLLLLTLANYKETFCGRNRVSPNEAFKHLLERIFEYEKDALHWKAAMRKISSSVRAFDVEAAKFLSNDEAFPNTTEEQRFFARIVKLYTKDCIHKKVNESLLREGQAIGSTYTYKPTMDDLALGPYTLMLDVLLFCWNELNPVKDKTYRGITLDDDDLKTYTEGTKFIWLSFVSSTISESVARGFGDTLFEISNDTCGAESWQPRLISHPLHDLHEYSHEKEALYPAGAEFQVEAIDSDKKIIRLKLLNPTAA